MVQSTTSSIDGSTSAIRVLVRAHKVACAAGALHTPALLLRSGITGRGNVGRHLRLHPAALVLCFFEQPTPGIGAQQRACAQSSRPQ
jgi:long-chain-alcohol oxidase